MPSTVMAVINEITRSRALQAAIWLAVGLFLLSAAAQLPALINRFIPPYVVEYGETVTPILQPGGTLRVVYRIDRRRLCRTDADRFIRRVPSQTVVWRDRVPGGASGVGRYHVESAFRLPADLPGGDYVLFTSIVSECSEGIHMTESPPVEFRVIP